MQSLKHIPKHKRAGRCYELAYKAVTEEPKQARLRLVHGWCYSRNHPCYYGHAWLLLPDGRVYDAVADKYFSMQDYAVQYRAIVGRIYTPKQAAKVALRHEYYGPWWTDEEKRLQEAADWPEVQEEPL